jgi:hypothetical protein
VRVHPPQPMCAPVLVFVVATGPPRRLPIGTLLDVPAEREDEPLRGIGDVGDRGLEGLGVPDRGLAEAADLANVLARGRLDLAGRGRVVLVAEGSDASAHMASVPAVPEGIARAHL